MSKIQEVICAYHETQGEEQLAALCEALRTAEELISAHVVLTKSYYITEEADGITAHLFTDEASYAAFEDRMSENVIAFKPVKNPAADRMKLLGDLHRCGITMLHVECGDESVDVSLAELMGNPDYSKLPENMRPIMNPDLLVKTHLFCQKKCQGIATAEDELAMFREIRKGTYVLAVDVSQEGKFGIAMIVNSKRQRFFPFFTDMAELRKYDLEGRLKGSVARFEDLKNYAAKIDGIVINYSGFRMVLDTALLELIENTTTAGEAPVARDTMFGMFS
ncbi:MAG: SseB family protein [Oscillospiraceae bacterium]|nr:SseB family protein [Oscillospiraceae bacterium]